MQLKIRYIISFKRYNSFNIALTFTRQEFIRQALIALYFLLLTSFSKAQKFLLPFFCGQRHTKKGLVTANDSTLNPG
jgi:hypothetical protein